MADRVSKSILNARVSLFYYFVQLILGFWSRKVFFDYLGSEILGLDTTLTNFLGFLNLAEMGIGTSVGYFLYKPLYNKDTDEINKIVCIQGWIYKRIAYLIIVLSSILMLFFPLIFEKSEIPLWYIYATFIVMLTGSLLGYFFNYKQIVLFADQKGYKLSRVTQGAQVLFKIILIVFLPYVSNPFIFYLSTNLCGHLFGCIFLDYLIKKEYNWLNQKNYNGKNLLKKYPEIIKKTKQVFIHRISGTILSEAAPLIMYTFSSLTTIAYYGNYSLVIKKMSQLLGTVFNSTSAGVGNLIASNNKENQIKVFWELFDSRLCISWSILFTIYFMICPFIKIWLGNEYLLSNTLLIIMVIQAGITINRTTVDSFIWGAGMFNDTWAPICEASANIFLSISLGYILNIEGVLLGGILSQTIFVGIWKPYFLFSKGLQISPIIYFKQLIQRGILLFITFIISNFVIKFIDLDFITSYYSFFKYSLITFLLIFSIQFILFYSATNGMKSFTYRIITLIKNKLS